MINNFDDPFEPSTADGKLIFYDALTNHTQEVVSDIDSVSDLNTNFNNQIVLVHLLVEDGWLEMLFLDFLLKMVFISINMN